jgi:hypothetical protein
MNEEVFHRTEQALRRLPAPNPVRRLKRHLVFFEGEVRALDKEI